MTGVPRALADTFIQSELLFPPACVVCVARMMIMASSRFVRSGIDPGRRLSQLWCLERRRRFFLAIFVSSSVLSNINYIRIESEEGRHLSNDCRGARSRSIRASRSLEALSRTVEVVGKSLTDLKAVGDGHGPRLSGDSRGVPQALASEGPRRAGVNGTRRTDAQGRRAGLQSS